MDKWNIYLSDKYNCYENWEKINLFSNRCDISNAVEKLLELNIFKNYFTVILHTRKISCSFYSSQKN
jgi:hypothetical protein